jgi:hypothetical protein
MIPSTPEAVRRDAPLLLPLCDAEGAPELEDVALLLPDVLFAALDVVGEGDVLDVGAGAAKTIQSNCDIKKARRIGLTALRHDAEALARCEDLRAVRWAYELNLVV